MLQQRHSFMLYPHIIKGSYINNFITGKRTSTFITMMSGCGFIFSLIDSIIFLPSINPFLKGFRIKLMTNYGPLYGLMIITSIIIQHIQIVPGAESPSKVFLDTGSWNKAQLVQNICDILIFSILYIKYICIFCAARYLMHLKKKAGDGVYYPQIGNKFHEKKKQHNISPISQYFPTVPVCFYWRQIWSKHSFT